MIGDRSPFSDPLTVRDVLYDSADRLALRTDALHRAKRSGRHAAHVIAALADEAMDHRRKLVTVEVGCGCGTTSRVIGERLNPASLTLTTRVDLPQALLLPMARTLARTAEAVPDSDHAMSTPAHERQAVDETTAAK
ncbi:MAG: hypothetical protein ACRDTE_20195 [Pseudonocardiaceae bacterium]